MKAKKNIICSFKTSNLHTHTSSQQLSMKIPENLTQQKLFLFLLIPLKQSSQILVSLLEDGKLLF